MPEEASDDCHGTPPLAQIAAMDELVERLTLHLDQVPADCVPEAFISWMRDASAAPPRGTLSLFKQSGYRDVLRFLLSCGAKAFEAEGTQGMRFYTALLALDALATKLSVLRPDTLRNSDGSWCYQYISLDGDEMVGVPAGLIPRMVPEVYPGPATAAIIGQIDDRSAEILAQLDFGTNEAHKPQFAFTVVGFGFSTSFCVPVVRVWTPCGGAEFFNGLTVPTLVTRSEVNKITSTPSSSELPTPSSELPTPSSELPTPSSKLPTPSSELPTPSPELSTPSSELPTPSSELPTPSSELPTPSSKLPTPSSPRGPQDFPPPLQAPPLAPPLPQHRVVVIPRKRTTGLPVMDPKYPLRDIAIQLLFGNAEDDVLRSKRLNFFKVECKRPAIWKAHEPLCHGSNISALEGEQRDSVSVFLCPEDRPTNCYLLTAHHVLREGHFNKPTDDVQCVSHLDVLRELAEVLGDRRLDLAQQETECGDIMAKINQKVARITASAMSSKANCWNEDWALAEVERSFIGYNGDFDEDALKHLLEIDSTSDIPEEMGIGDAGAGDKVFKIGATTGMTSGVVNGTKLLNYQQHMKPSLGAEKSVLAVIFPNHLLPGGGDKAFCARGDSGAGIFKLEGTRVSWVGLLVGSDNSYLSGKDALGLFVPQDVVLAQIRGGTGRRWCLFGSE